MASRAFVRDVAEKLTRNEIYQILLRRFEQIGSQIKACIISFYFIKKKKHLRIKPMFQIILHLTIFLRYKKKSLNKLTLTPVYHSTWKYKVSNK